MRYYIANKDGIPYRSQPENGYTELKVIAAVHRYATEDAKLFGGTYTDYIHDYTILSYDGRRKPGHRFVEANELYTAL